MRPLRIAGSADHFVIDGQPFVLCADTVWAAFGEARPHEWETYLARRRAQGFNTVLVSVLPILHDRSVQETTREPFRRTPSGTYDVTAPDPVYFATARDLVERAAEQGIRAALVALWCEYVPGTRGLSAEPPMVMSEEDTETYLDLLTRTFSAYSPIYVASGDDRFDTPEVVRRYALTLERLRERAPDCLTTLHATPDTELPAELADSPHLDFYGYQSGHGMDKQGRAYELAEQARARPVRRPVVNLEPCYEGHGFGGGRGRFTRTEVRRATWWSLLAGANAGIGYGAHGLWGWHRSGGRFTSVGWSGQPFPWDVALGFEGAWDVGFARALVEDHGLFRTEPRQDLLRQAPPGTRVAATPDLRTLAVYLPHPFDVELAVDLGGVRARAWNLATRCPVVPRLASAAGGATVVRQPDHVADTLYLLTW